jgi:hypothetical protein
MHDAGRYNSHFVPGNMIHPVKDTHSLGRDTATDTSKSRVFKFLALTSCTWHHNNSRRYIFCVETKINSMNKER